MNYDDKFKDELLALISENTDFAGDCGAAMDAYKFRREVAKQEKFVEEITDKLKDEVSSQDLIMIIDLVNGAFGKANIGYKVTEVANQSALKYALQLFSATNLYGEQHERATKMLEALSCDPKQTLEELSNRIKNMNVSDATIAFRNAVFEIECNTHNSMLESSCDATVQELCKIATPLQVDGALVAKMITGRNGLYLPELILKHKTENCGCTYCTYRNGVDGDEVAFTTEYDIAKWEKEMASIKEIYPDHKGENCHCNYCVPIKGAIRPATVKPTRLQFAAQWVKIQWRSFTKFITSNWFKGF